MTTSCNSASSDASFVLRYQSLFNPGRGFEFPCDAGGHVDMDALSERSLRSYLYARAVVGCELAMPIVRQRARIMADAQPRNIKEFDMSGAF